jgi:hypothetical protein
MLGRMDQIHAEYVVPLTLFPVDLLSSVTGEMWEIKPWDSQMMAVGDINIRVAAMNTARYQELLKGTNPLGMPYDWNYAPPLWSLGSGFPAEMYVGTDDTGWWDIYAGQTRLGVIAWWKYHRDKPIIVPVPIQLPQNMKWNERNKRPGWQPRLAPAYAQCVDPATGAIVIGGTIIWWLGKLLSPGCGPLAPACAIVF